MKATLRIFPASVLLALFLTPQSSPADGVVNEATESGLRAALTGGGTVTFAVDGTIALANPLVITDNTVLDGAGHLVILTGSNAIRVLHINSGVQFTLLNLAVADGRTNQGAGLYNSGGSVTISNCIFSGNTAGGAVGQAVSGGAI